MSCVYTHFELRFASEEEAKKAFDFVYKFGNFVNETDYRIELDGCIISDDGGDDGAGFSSKYIDFALEQLLYEMEEELDFVPVKSFTLVDARETDDSWVFECWSRKEKILEEYIYFEDEDDPYDKFDEVLYKVKQLFTSDKE